MVQKCYYWCFHVLSNTSNWWGWEKNFPSKWMSWIIFQMLCRFWIFLCIFMFLPSDFNVSCSLTYVWLLTRTYTFVNYTWWMGISTFQFKQLFNFLSDPLNTNIIFIISKNIKLFHKAFGKFLISWTVWYIHQNNLLWNIKETRGNDVVVFWKLLMTLWYKH